MKYYIKKRINPQFEKPYYIACGKMSKKKAKEAENSLFGYNVMLAYDDEESYLKAIEEFKSESLNVLT